VTTNTVVNTLKILGTETEPPGYTQNSIATIRLWKKAEMNARPCPPRQNAIMPAEPFCGLHGGNFSARVAQTRRWKFAEDLARPREGRGRARPGAGTSSSGEHATCAERKTVPTCHIASYMSVKQIRDHRALPPTIRDFF